MTEKNNSDFLQRMDQRKIDAKNKQENRQKMYALEVAVRHQGKEINDLKKMLFELVKKIEQNEKIHKGL